MLIKTALTLTLLTSLSVASEKKSLPSSSSLDNVNALAADYVTTPILTRVPYLADQIGTLVGGLIMYPSIPQAILEEEDRFARVDADPANVSILSDPFKKEINEKFQRFYEEIFLEEFGLKTTCLVIESKDGNRDLPPYNLFFFAGNLSLASFCQDLRPFARAALEEAQGADLPVVRLIALCFRDIQKIDDGKTYIPRLAETGDIHRGIFDRLMEKYGKVNQVVAFSMGSAVASKLLTAIQEDSTGKYPNRWWFHAAPSSLEEVSKNYWTGRSVLWPALKLSGQDVDLIDSIASYRANNESAFIGISGLVEDLDYYFPGKSGLCNHPKISEANDSRTIDELVLLQPSRAEYHPRNFHRLPLDYYDSVHVINPKTGDFYINPVHSSGEALEAVPFIQPGEHLARAILRSGLKTNLD